MRHFTRHLSHYLSLTGLLLVALVGLIVFKYDPTFQTAIVISLGISFVIWGVVHHWLHEGLKIRLILEYLGVAAFGMAILLALIWSV
ncbi:MAG: hypothetical protein A2782_04270 [Candidatus Blackburnbacteria bacterium RIFCSPHIGHO2_01_FULL_43_15b]|uniref:Uncharacterized protein n=1 Tax=Candidatus Blackburnbacteria bacterium RIFCSPHIGHO2_01_FULL_43_15b TaxID=1797513 RepID=A0A1G1V052_9BACT|nr:MAG: hypothetical protein A2782_04270 [Candidatus Blackburnbacteria bacterium RIFCSPHIGHO2_01_FULL_43_15b]